MLVVTACAVEPPESPSPATELQQPSDDPAAHEVDRGGDAAVGGVLGERGGVGEAPEVAHESPPRRFTIAAAGDILPHTAVIERAAAYGEASGHEYDFRPMFAEVEPVLAGADLAVCHLEVPLSADNADVYGGGDRRTPGDAPLFHAPWQLADGIAAAGFDACSTAHNHSLDAGADGVTTTLDALEAAGVGAAGTARTAEEAAEPVIYDVNEVAVAHLSATYGLNNVPMPQDQPWLVDVIDVDTIVADAEAARAAGAEFVLVSLHHGVEYQVEPSDAQRSRADALLANDAIDAIVGHHAHVVQPIDRRHGKVVAYGLGNFLSNQHPDLTGPRTVDGVIVLVEVVEADGAGGFVVDAVSFVPTWVDRTTHVIVDVGAALADDTLDERRRAELEASWDRTVEAITGEGAEVWGVTAATPVAAE